MVRKSTTKNLQKMNEYKYNIGFIVDSFPMRDSNYLPTKTIVYYIFTVGRRLKYFISSYRSDLERMKPVLFALDSTNDNKITECLPITSECVYSNVESGNESLCGIYTTQKWIDKIKSHQYSLFSFNEKDSYYVYYKYKDLYGTIKENVHNLLSSGESEGLYYYMNIQELEKQNSMIECKEAFDEDCLQTITKKIEDISQRINNIDLESIISDYQINIDTSYITKVGGDDRIYVYMKTKDDERIDSYLSLLLPIYYMLLYKDSGYGNLYRDVDYELFKKEAKRIECNHKKDFYKKYDKKNHISVLLCEYLNETCRNAFAPKLKKMNNELEIAKSKIWLTQNFCLEQLYYTALNRRSESEVMEWINKHYK